VGGKKSSKSAMWSRNSLTSIDVFFILAAMLLVTSAICWVIACIVSIESMGPAGVSLFEGVRHVVL